jgi:hypothetical protein
MAPVGWPMTGHCRAGCGVELDATLIEADGDGLHPSCHEPIGPVIPRLAGILARHQAAMPRSRQIRVGPSQLGVECDRALAYQAFGHPGRGGLAWAPLVGTWAHTGIAAALEAENVRIGRRRYLVEARVTVSEEMGISGTTDAYDQDTDEVMDWKLVGKWSLDHYRRHGPGGVYRTQAHLYALGWRNAGYIPRGVRVVFLPRASANLDDGHEWAEPPDYELAEAALRRYERVVALGHAVMLDRMPAHFALIPATTGDACRFCDYRRPGGPADGTGCPGDTAQALAKAEGSMGAGIVA